MVYQVRFAEEIHFREKYARASSRRPELVRDLLPHRQICEKIDVILTTYNLLNSILYNSIA